MSDDHFKFTYFLTRTKRQKNRKKEKKERKKTTDKQYFSLDIKGCRENKNSETIKM